MSDTLFDPEPYGANTNCGVTGTTLTLPEGTKLPYCQDCLAELEKEDQ